MENPASSESSEMIDGPLQQKETLIDVTTRFSKQCSEGEAFRLSVRGLYMLKVEVFDFNHMRVEDVEDVPEDISRLVFSLPASLCHVH